MGKLIAIDGLDGSGKATQTKILANRLEYMGKNVHRVSFPDYSSPSSTAVRMYLNGEVAKDAASVNPYMSSIFYTIDRAIQFKQELFEVYNTDGAILLCDRYLSANIIHQGGKLDTAEEKIALFDWVYDLEVNKVGLPSDDLTIVLSLPVQVSQNLMLARYNNDESRKDIHEADVAYLQKCYNTVGLAVSHLSSVGHNWVKIDCHDGSGGIRKLESISDEIWEHVKNVID